MIRQEKGVTLIALAIAVIIILAITGVTIYSAKDRIYIKNLTDMQNDISNLRDKVELYYSEYGKIPASTEYVNTSHMLEAGVLGKNDTGKFLIIEMELLDGLTLNYGKDYEKYKKGEYTKIIELEDLYIINENSHNIFYVSGIAVKENDNVKVYYTDYTTGDSEEVIKIERTVVDGVIIPKNFYYVGGTKYSGIVISDDKADENAYENEEKVGTDLQGNQYVWIQVDGILGEDGTLEDVKGENKKVLLGRYEFDSNGIPKNVRDTYIEETQEQHNASGYGNAVAKDIEQFIQSVREYGGYYIGRFEASNGGDGKADTKYNEKVWNRISQPEASSACQNLYEDINSDLINSYVWDTTVLFIQKYGTETNSSKYSIQSGQTTNLKIENTGKSILNSTKKEDVQCNIYDLSGNCNEFVTETNDERNVFCAVRRGGYYDGANTVIRFETGTESYPEEASFRTVLYL